MKTKMILVAAMAMVLVMAFSTMVGCSSQAPNDQVPLAEGGCLFLKVNPEIAVYYDKDGLVTKMEGTNDDGKAIVKKVKDYVGKDANAVIKALVKEINSAGYFEPDENGKYREVTVRVEPGSALPDDDFLDSIASDVQKTVKELNLDEKVGVTKGDSQYGKDSAGKTNYGDSAYGGTITVKPETSEKPKDSGYAPSSPPSVTTGDSKYENNNSGYGNSNTSNDSSDNNSGYGNSNTSNNTSNDSSDSNSGYGNSNTSNNTSNDSSDNNSGYGNSNYDE